MRRSRAIQTLDDIQEHYFLNEWPASEPVMVAYTGGMYEASVECVLGRELGYFIGDFSRPRGSKALAVPASHVAYTFEGGASTSTREWVLMPQGMLWLHIEGGSSSGWRQREPEWLA